MTTRASPYRSSSSDQPHTKDATYSRIDNNVYYYSGKTRTNSRNSYHEQPATSKHESYAEICRNSYIDHGGVVAADVYHQETAPKRTLLNTVVVNKGEYDRSPPSVHLVAPSEEPEVHQLQSVSTSSQNERKDSYTENFADK